MNKKCGMGLPELPSNITTFLPFFMVVEVPYSVQRNEILELDIAFFNNIDEDQIVTISIKDRSYFEGVDLTEYGWECKTHYCSNFFDAFIFFN